MGKSTITGPFSIAVSLPEATRRYFGAHEAPKQSPNGPQPGRTPAAPPGHPQRSPGLRRRAPNAQQLPPRPAAGAMKGVHMFYHCLSICTHTYILLLLLLLLIIIIIIIIIMYIYIYMCV